MAKQKELISLDALLRVRKVSLADFIQSQQGTSVDEKISRVLSLFNVSSKAKEELVALAKEAKAEAKAAQVAAHEETKKVRKNKAQEKEIVVSLDEDVIEAEKNEQDT